MDVMDEVLRGLGNVEGKLDALLRAHEEEKTERKALGTRVTTLEKKQWWLSGVGGAFAFLLGVVIKIWK